jgi:hypothetical protein
LQVALAEFTNPRLVRSRERPPIGRHVNAVIFIEPRQVGDANVCFLLLESHHRRCNRDDLLQELILRPSNRRGTQCLFHDTLHGLGQIVEIVFEKLFAADSLSHEFGQLPDSSGADAGRAQEQLGDLLGICAAPQETQTAKQRDFGGRQVFFVRPQQPRQPKCLTVVGRRTQAGRFGRAARVTVEKSADESAEMVQRQGVGAVVLDEPRRIGIITVNASRVQQGCRRGDAQPSDVDPAVSALRRLVAAMLGLQVGKWKPARYQHHRPGTLCKPRKQPLEERVFDLPVSRRGITLLALHALQAVEYQQMGTALLHTFAEEMEQRHSFGRHCPRIGMKVAAGALKEQTRIRLLVKAPNEQSVRLRLKGGLLQLIEEACGDGRFACPAQADESHHAADPLLP